jgi:hypothetical protein
VKRYRRLGGMASGKPVNGVFRVGLRGRRGDKGIACKAMMRTVIWETRTQDLGALRVAIHLISRGFI